MEYTEFFKKAKEKNITNIQVTEKNNIEGLVELIDGEIDTFNESNNISYNIKADIDGKTYKVSTNYLDDEIIDLIIMKSEATDTKYEDFIDIFRGCVQSYNLIEKDGKVRKLKMNHSNCISMISTEKLLMHIIAMSTTTYWS